MQTKWKFCPMVNMISNASMCSREKKYLVFNGGNEHDSVVDSIMVAFLVEMLRYE